MNDHATATRRQFLRYAGLSAAASAVGVAAIRTGVLGATGVTAEFDTLGAAATAIDPAIRIALVPPDPGELVLPVATGDGLIVLDNFGGTSVSFGSCSHRGIDVFPTTEATRTLVACTDALIEGQRFNAGAQGNAWILQDDQGISYRYHHIDEFAEGLEVGMFVERGQPIATMGQSGNAGSDHLHFEVRLDGSSGTAIDPIPLFTFPIPGVELRQFGGAADCE